MSNEKIKRAASRIEKLIKESSAPVYGPAIESRQIAFTLAKAEFHGKENEGFLVFYLTSQHQLIKKIMEFEGTVSSSHVYPRSIVKRALELNAAAVIFAHNHPSGVTTPSQADKDITQKLKTVLEIIDVTVLDHIVIGDNNSEPYSFLANHLM